MVSFIASDALARQLTARSWAQTEDGRVVGLLDGSRYYVQYSFQPDGQLLALDTAEQGRLASPLLGVLHVQSLSMLWHSLPKAS